MSVLATLFLITLSAPEPQSELCRLADDLNEQIALATGYLPPPCPPIGFSVLPEGGALRSQGGAFFPDTGEIELAPDLDLTTAYGQSYLIHELVHAAQYANGAETRVACTAQLEAEAYNLQSDFLRDKGLSREALLIRLLANHLGVCGSPDYD